MSDSVFKNEIAPEGKVWRCQACGKLSLDLYGDQALSWGWDESCILNAKLVDTKEIAKKSDDENKK